LEELGATASAVISFVERLEEDTARFYERLATAYPEQKETFLAFAKDCRKNKTLVTRTYQETVTDALETGYSFKGLVLGDFMPHVEWKEGKPLAVALGSAISLEGEAVRLYADLAARSKTLLSTIPTAFCKVADVRAAHISRLELAARPS
jgi:rubrerythrin